MTFSDFFVPVVFKTKFIIEALYKGKIEERKPFKNLYGWTAFGEINKSVKTI